VATSSWATIETSVRKVRAVVNHLENPSFEEKYTERSTLG
jgi:hypothetical protein